MYICHLIGWNLNHEDSDRFTVIVISIFSLSKTSIDDIFSWHDFEPIVHLFCCVLVPRWTPKVHPSPGGGLSFGQNFVRLNSDQGNIFVWFNWYKFTVVKYKMAGKMDYVFQNVIICMLWTHYYNKEQLDDEILGFFISCYFRSYCYYKRKKWNKSKPNWEWVSQSKTSKHNENRNIEQDANIFIRLEFNQNKEKICLVLVKANMDLTDLFQMIFGQPNVWLILHDDWLKMKSSMVSLVRSSFYIC